MENTIFLGGSFQWNINHQGVQNYEKQIYSISMEEKQENEDIEKPDFPLIYNKVIEGERRLEKSKSPEWMDA
jgi:hypothetical protein